MVNGVTAWYLVEYDANPTVLPQILEEESAAMV